MFYMIREGNSVRVVMGDSASYRPGFTSVRPGLDVIVPDERLRSELEDQWKAFCRQPEKYNAVIAGWVFQWCEERCDKFNSEVKAK